MKPHENQNPVSQQVSPEQVTSPEAQPTTGSMPTTLSPQPNKSHKKLLITLVVVVLVIGGVGYALYHSKHTTKTNTPTVSTKTTNNNQSTVAVATNTWTGKGKNYNWNDANNWSLGVPKNNQILEINIADVTPPTDQYGAINFDFHDNIPNLTINKLVIDGHSSNGSSFNINGSPLTVTNGIEDTATRTSSTGYSTEIHIENQINIDGNGTIETTGQNLLSFSSANTANSGEVINLATSTLQFNTTGTSEIDISGAIAGTGTILIPNNSVASDSSVIFYNSSPNFNGKVVIGSGDTVDISNQANSTGGNSATDAFGSSSINIMNGGNLSIFTVGTSSFNVNNSITVSGNGVSQSNGSISGAILACLTSAEEGCGASEDVTFSGQVKLLGNTQIGQSTPTSLGANNTHVSYTFNNLDKNGYTLNTVTDYFYNAEF